MKDITFKDKDIKICPKCKIPLTFDAYRYEDNFPFATLIFLFFTPKSWVKELRYKCDKCKHLYSEKI